MRLLLALLLGGAAANPLLSLASKAKSLVTAKSLQLGGGIGAALPVLNTLREAASNAEDKRQGIQESLRDKAKNTAKYVVWYHRNQKEVKTEMCTKEEFCKMLSMARPIMKKKLRRRGRLARWFTASPSEELVEIYVREEIAEVLKADNVTLQDGEKCPEWTTKKMKPWCFAWWPRKITLPCTMCQPEATGTCKNNQGKGKVIKVLGAVASIAVGVALLPFK